MGLEAIYNYLQISETIGTAGQPSAEQVTIIAEMGYQVVINLGLKNTDYAIEDEAGLVTSLGMTYVHIPVVWEKPTKSDLDQFFKVLQQNEEKRLFIHCAANMRVSAFMALYRMLHLGWSRERAFEDVYRIWTPNEVWRKFIDDILASSK